MTPCAEAGGGGTHVTLMLVEESVVSLVLDIQPGPTVDQEPDHVQVTLLTSDHHWGEPVYIPLVEITPSETFLLTLFLHNFLLPTFLSTSGQHQHFHCLVCGTWHTWRYL